MPRYAVSRWGFSLVVVALCAVSAAACVDKRDVTAPDDSAAPVPDAAPQQEDASMMPPPPAMDASNSKPQWQWDGSTDLGDWEGEYCFLHVAAECDGAEDCMRAGGGTGACCARLEPGSFIYTSIECADECDFRQTFPLCHAGQTCTADGSTVCRTSFLLPEFVGVCAVPLPTRGPPTGEEVAGEIDCGPERCVVGAEQCCLRRGFDTDQAQTVAHEPYCAPLGAPCDCDDQSVPPRDAGEDAIVSEDDAG
jgi:hypothetical protein